MADRLSFRKLNVDLLNLIESGKACQISQLAVIGYRGFGEPQRNLITPEHVSSPLRPSN